MTRFWLGLALLAGVAAVVFLALGQLLELSGARVLDAYILFVGGLVMLGLVQLTRPRTDGRGSDYERALRRRAHRRVRPRQLERLEREVSLATVSAFDFHARIRPLLRQVAEHRLASRRGVDLDRETRAARTLLGDDVWDLVRADREPPEDRFAPGLPLERLRSTLDTIEKV